MEKLIELLNEYEDDVWEEPHTRSIEDGHIKHCNSFTCQFWDYLFDVFVCSKKYGFIKWLVENNKIDRDKVQLKIKALGKDYGWFDIYSGIVENCLLMLLAISDTPIDDLVSYLK